MRTAIILALLLSPALACGADKPSIRLPLSKSHPVEPTAVSELDSTQLFVLQSDSACRVLASRAGHLKITPATGPLSVFALFVDPTTPGEPELRTYEAKFLWLIRAGTPGETELIIAPRESLVSDDSDVIRRTLVVSGIGPRPPPGPTPPGPFPPLPPWPPAPVDPVVGLRVMMVYESAQNHTREQLNILNSTAITTRLNEVTTKGANGVAGWRRWDVHTDSSKDADPIIRELWSSVKPKLGKLPQLVIARGSNVTVQDLPATEALTLETINKAVSP